MKTLVDPILEWICFKPSVWINVNLMGGKPGQPICARAWVEHWPRTERFLNAICWPYESQHCRMGYIRWLERQKQ